MTLAGTGMLPVLWKEWRQSRQLLAGALIAIVAMPLLLAAVMFRYFHHATGGVDVLWAPGATVVVLILTTPLLAVILAARIFCRDFGADTETFLLSKPVRPSTVVAAKFAAGFGVLATVVVVSLGLETLLAALTGTLGQMKGFPREFGEVATVVLPLVLAIFTATAAAAVWLRRTTSAALVGLFLVALWCTLPLIVRSLGPVDFGVASAVAGYSGPYQTARRVAAVWLLGLAFLAAVLCIVLAHWPARRQVRPKHLAIAAAAVILVMFLGLTRQVGNNLRIVESMSTPPGTFGEFGHEAFPHVGPVVVNGRFVCVATHWFLHCFEWNSTDGLTAHRKMQISDVDGTTVRILSLVPGNRDDVWLVRERYAQHENESGSTFDGIDLLRVRVQESGELATQAPLVLYRRQEGRPPYVGVQLVVKGHYGYLLWVESHTDDRVGSHISRRRGPLSLRVLDLSQPGEPAVVHEQTIFDACYWPGPSIELHGSVLVVTPTEHGPWSLLVRTRSAPTSTRARARTNIATPHSWEWAVRFDISVDPTKPRRLPALPDLDADSMPWRLPLSSRFATDGQLLCVANIEGLWLYRLSPDGSKWQSLGQRYASFLEMALSGQTPRLRRVGDRLYAATQDFGLIVYDLSDPTHPRRIAHWDPSPNIRPLYEARYHIPGVDDYLILPCDWPRQGPRLLVAERP